MSPDQDAGTAAPPATEATAAPAEAAERSAMRPVDDTPRARAGPLGEVVRAVARRLERARVAFGHGTGNALDEASWLVLHASGLSPVEAFDPNRPVDPAGRAAIDALVRRRIEERVPTAYLTGRAWFAGHEFLCDARALVPRSPLAEMIECGLPGLVDADRPVRVLDLCTGGGCIGIACALALPLAAVDASDLSGDALALAAENVALHGLEGRVRLLEGSLYEPVDGPYDLILSNPPYVDAADLAAMPDEYRREPPMGLGAGEDGLSLVHDILAGAPAVLAPGGRLVVEVGNSMEALERAYPDVPFEWIEFGRGGDGVFTLDRAALVAAPFGADRA